MTIRLGYQEETDFYRLLAGLGMNYLEVDAVDEMWSCHIVGLPGHGKSVLLQNLAEQFVAAGDGVLLMDLKGDLARSAVTHTRFFDRVIYIDPAEAKRHHHYWSLNPLEFDRDDTLNYEYYANNLFDLFVRIGAVDPAIMVEIKKVMSEAIALALSRKGTTLVDVFLALHDEAHRRYLLDAPHLPPMNRQFWVKMFLAMSPRDRASKVDKTDTRIRDIMRGDYMSRMLAHPTSSLKLMEWLDQGKYVIFNLNQSVLSASTARRMANLVLGYLAGEINRRPEGQVAPMIRIIVDEATELATKPFAEMINQMRTYNAFPIFAHQNLGQLNNSPELRDAAEGAAVKIALQVTEADAAVIGRRRGSEAGEEAETLGKYRAVVTRTQGPPDAPRRQKIMLLPVAEEDHPDQLRQALDRQLELALHENKMQTLFDFDHFNRGTTEGHHERRKPPDNQRKDRQAKENHPTPPPPRPHAGQDLPERDDSGVVRGVASPEQPPLAGQQAAPRPPVSPPPVVPPPGPSEKIGRGHRKGLQPPQPYTPQRPRADHPKGDPS